MLNNVILFLAASTATLSLAGSRQLAYDTQIAGVPVLSALSFLALFLLVCPSCRGIFQTPRRPRPLLTVLSAILLSAVAIAEAEGIPNFHQLRLVVPTILMLLVVSVPSQVVGHTAFNIIISAPLLLALILSTLSSTVPWLLNVAPTERTLFEILFPTQVRGDTFVLLVIGPIFLLLGNNLGVRQAAGRLVAASALILYAQTYSSHKATPLVIGAFITVGLFLKALHKRWIYLILLAVTFGGAIVGPNLRDQAQNVILSSPSKKTSGDKIVTAESELTLPQEAFLESTTPQGSTLTSDEVGDRVDLFQPLRLEGSELARLTTWADIFTALTSAKKVLLGDDSSDPAALLRACGGDPREYPARKCDLDNGAVSQPDGTIRLPLAYAHNWIMTLLFNFGLVGLSCSLLILSSSLSQLRISPQGTPLLVITFLIGGLVSAYFFSPFIAPYFMMIALIGVNGEQQTRSKCAG